MLIWIAALAALVALGAVVIGRRAFALEALKVAGFALVLGIAVQLVFIGLGVGE